MPQVLTTSRDPPSCTTNAVDGIEEAVVEDEEEDADEEDADEEVVDEDLEDGVLETTFNEAGISNKADVNPSMFFEDDEDDEDDDDEDDEDDEEERRLVNALNKS